MPDLLFTPQTRPATSPYALLSEQGGSDAKPSTSPEEESSSVAEEPHSRPDGIATRTTIEVRETAGASRFSSTSRPRRVPRRLRAAGPAAVPGRLNQDRSHIRRPSYSMAVRDKWRDIAAGAQTERRGGAVV